MAVAEKLKMEVIIQAKNATKAVMNDFKKTMEDSAKTMKQAFKAGEIAVLGFATAITGSAIVAMKKMFTGTNQLIKGAIDTADSFELLKIQISNLRGSTEEGNRVFEQLWKTAQQIPFTIDEIAASAKRLEAWGVTGEDVETVMLNIADASAAAGVSMEVMANTVGRAWQRGSFMARGPGAMLRGIMKTKMGIDATKLSVTEFQDAVVKMFNDPQYGIAGMAQKMANTWTGIKSMIGDSMTAIKLEIAQGGVFDEVKSLGKTIMTGLRSEEVLSRVRQIGEIAGSVIREFHAKILDMMESGSLAELLDDWVRNFRRWSNIAKNLIANLPTIAQAIMNMVSSIGMGIQQMFKMIDSMMKKLEKFGIGTSISSELDQVHADLATFADDLMVIERDIKAFEKHSDWVLKGMSPRQELEVLTRYNDNLKKRNELIKERQGYLEKEARLVNFRDFLKEGFNLEIDLADITKQLGVAWQDVNDETEDNERNTRNLLEAYNKFAPEVKTLKDRWEEINKEFEESGGMAMEASKIWANAFEDFFFDSMMGELKDLNDYADQVFRNLGRMLAQYMAQQMMLKMVGGFGSSSASVLPGAGANQSAIPADMMNMSPMPQKDGGVIGFASGGFVGGRPGTDRIPIMATAGEMVLNKRQQQNLFNMIKAGGMGQKNVYINAVDTRSFYDALTRDRRMMGSILNAGRFNSVRGFR